MDCYKALNHVLDCASSNAEADDHKENEESWNYVEAECFGYESHLINYYWLLFIEIGQSLESET